MLMGMVYQGQHTPWAAEARRWCLPASIPGLFPDLSSLNPKTHADSYEKNQQDWFVGCYRLGFTMVESGL
jgi:hypothetical protein